MIKLIMLQELEQMKMLKLIMGSHKDCISECSHSSLYQTINNIIKEYNYECLYVNKDRI